MLGVHHTASSKEWRKAHSKLCSLTQRDVPYITMKVQDEMYVYKGSFFASNEEEIETHIITQKEELEEYEAETSIELQIAYRNKKIQMYSSTLTIDEETQYSLHFFEQVYTDYDGLHWYNADSYSFNPNSIKCIIDIQIDKAAKVTIQRIQCEKAQVDEDGDPLVEWTDITFQEFLDLLMFFHDCKRYMTHDNQA